MQPVVLGSEESSPGSVRLFGALYFAFSPHFIAEVFAFSVPRLKRISKLQGQEAPPVKGCGQPALGGPVGAGYWDRMTPRDTVQPQPFCEL